MLNYELLNCKEHTTLLVPSRTPYTFGTEFDGWHTLNTVQIVKEHKEMHFALCAAIAKVQTKFFTLVDDDDPFPTFPETIENVGITFGDNFINYKGETKRFPFVRWNFNRHVRHLSLIHRAICRTEDANRILSQVNQECIYTEQWLYSHLMRESTFNYDPSYEAIWYKKDTGLHTKIREVRSETVKLYKKKYGNRV